MGANNKNAAPLSALNGVLEAQPPHPYFDVWNS